MKFIALYQAPISIIEDWLKTPEKERNAAEAKMRTEWQAWERKHKLKETVAVGATKRVTASGISDTKNDVMLYSLLEAGSAEDAAEMFEDHPHLQIPESSIEIMPVRAL